MVATGSGGSVEGLVTFHGAVPKSRVADDAGVYRDLLRVDPESRGLENVVVWLAAEPSSPIKEATAGSWPVALMDQRDHEFVPRVLAVRAGQPVKFSNSDPANHNVRTASPQRSNEFNVFTGTDGSYTHRFAAESPPRPVRVGCDIHPWMRAWIYVFDHGRFAVTDERGRFRLGAVPPGDYELIVEQPDVRFQHRQRVVVSRGPVIVPVEVRVDRLPAANDQGAAEEKSSDRKP